MQEDPIATIDDAGDPFAALVRAVEACVAADPLALTDGEVIDAVLGLAGVVGRVDAVLGSHLGGAAGAVVAHPGSGPVGGVVVGGAVGAGTRSGQAQLVNVGRQLPACPLVDEAVGSAVLGTAKVELLLRARDGLEELFAEHESGLIARWRR